ncbi:potassium channel family protein [Nakamurella endophytica]|uniref:NAD-binding protein of Kef-type K+ transporter n=1 Tax=Nakamurella endophytica TaxID=1748367 RepID=A0A917WMG9_9ACTN|nr:potassium channel family protein [Nakamurella endophytica]GGM15327.1 NAD-binding protein of Kef-type K+ transporter [Nakamurella endophytica]
MPDDVRSRILFPERDRGPVRAIVVRLFVAVACIVVVAVVVYLERHGYRDGDGRVRTLLDAFYYATVTLSTTGYGDITPVTESARLTNILLVTPLRFLFLIVLVGTTIEVLTERSRQLFRFQRWRRRVKQHTVVIGFGTKGRSAARALIDQGYPAESIVVVDTNGGNVKGAGAMGCVAVLGDARREEVLRQAAVPTAERIIVAADRDDTNVLVTLTARRLAPTATIAAAAREEQNIGVLRQGGADVVIPTAESAGRMLGLSISAPNAGEVIEDLLEPMAGLAITERVVRPEDVGLSPARLTAQGEIVLTVIRNGVAHRFDSGGVKVFQPGDVIVVISGNGPAARDASTKDAGPAASSGVSSVPGTGARAASGTTPVVPPSRSVPRPAIRRPSAAQRRDHTDREPGDA